MHRVAILALAVTMGCVVSSEGVVTDEQAQFDPELLGHWEEVGGSAHLSISPGPGTTYVVEYDEDGDEGRFTARLGRLGGRRVLDIQPDPGPGAVADPYGGLFLPGHLLVVLEGSGSEELRVSTIEPESLLADLTAGRVPLAYDTTDGLVLHGTTEALRTAMAARIRAGALQPEGTWRRIPPSGMPPRPVDVPCFEAGPWREADRLFRGDDYWRGADGASTVDLGGDRVLWLFSDTWIDPSGQGTREGATMISNSVAVQTGRDPSTASITFYWGTGPEGEPTAMFPDRDGERLWFGSGARVGDRLVLFMGRVGPGPGLGFKHLGWTAFLVANPEDPPSRWRIRELETPENPLGVLVGFAATLQRDGYVHALGSQNPVKSHPVFAVRWPVEKVLAGDLVGPEWWAGSEGWVPDSSATQRWPIFENGASELSVHRDSATGVFLAVHHRGFGPADVLMRASPSLTGPWTDARLVYRPPEFYKPHATIYAAKAHPELDGADLVLTYATNSFELGEHLTDPAVYYPRFVGLTRCHGS